MANHALLIGQPDDPHITKVGTHLRKMGIEPVLLNPSTDLVSMSVLRGVLSGYVVSAPTNEKVKFESIRSVWNRLKQHCPDDDIDPAARAEIRFAWSEWLSSIESISDFVSPNRWINPVLQEQLMSRKAVQHTLASAVGFRIPDTAITNDIDSVIRLFSKHERVIYKPNRAANLTNCRLLFTTEINFERVKCSETEIALAPGIYQELIEKEYELRVTIVGETIFAVRIDSQKSKSTSLDWRQGDQGSEFLRSVEIDASLKQSLLKFHAKSNLVYGAYDLVITTGGEPVFLEVNPAGQWMWLENTLGIPISNAIASQLAGF